MAFPRTKVQIQNDWRSWLETYTAGWDATEKAETKLMVSREIYWMITDPNFEQDVGRRLAKISSLRAAYDDDALFTAFDPRWEARRDLLTWMGT